ncbi:MAG: hypothetical protein NC300_12950, partial [Bacteroidales bacterium]|nr:hypothetical protein [Clostridium sp.]MCM1205043.1 hypothetical protein [Bacteroidales bacterium]
MEGEGCSIPAESVSGNFDSGASYLLSRDNYEYYICTKGTGLVGRPDGQFVAPVSEMDDVLLQADNNPRIMEELLGLDSGSLGESPVRVNILNPKDYDLRLPDASMSGANDNFVPGAGKTSGGVSEGVINQFPNPDYAPEIGSIEKTSTSLDKLKGADSFADSLAETSAGNGQGDLSKMIGFIAKHPEATARVLAYGAIGVSAYNMCKRACSQFESGNDHEGYRIIARWAVTTEASMLGIWAGAALGGMVGGPLGFIIGLGLGWGLGMGAEYGTGLLFDELFDLYDKAGAYTYPVDPLIFDLDGDGVETVSVKNGVNFDFDNNGFAEKIGWVGADDGLLVRDLNQNGRIDNGGELFGDWTAVAEDVNAVNGFEALKAFDENGDGVIDFHDGIYGELRIWQDKNLNGAVDEGELMSLQTAGISAVSLDYNTINETDGQGNAHTQQGYYIKSDGSAALVEDVWFDKDAADTVATGPSEDMVFLEETEAVRRLPDITGSGNQYSLHQAMLRDGTGTLQALVEQYVQEEDLLARKAMLTQMVYVWTGVADKNPFGRGENLADARKLEALEVITGREFNSRYGKNPVAGAADYIEQAFDRLIDLYYIQMERQTSCAEMYGILIQNFDVDDRGNLYFGVDGLADYLAPVCGENPDRGRALLINFVKNLQVAGMINQIKEEELLGEVGELGEKYVHALEYIGDDTLFGSEDGDILTGEAGNDILHGGKGNDTYLFNPGDGKDIIYEDGGEDRIVFGREIRPEDIRVSRDRWNLYLTNTMTGDRIQVNDYFRSGENVVEQIVFADGTVWNIKDTEESASYYYGTERNDTISAYNRIFACMATGSASTGGAIEVGVDDYLYGWGGNDTLRGNLGDDHLIGGMGNDKLYGGDGNDAYLFDAGDGKDIIYEDGGIDRIVFGEGIRAEDIRITRDSQNLHLTNRKTGDCITVNNYFRYENAQIESIEFADGTVWDREWIKDKSRYYYGTTGEDSLSAYGNNYGYAYEDDYLYGGEGNDRLYGNNGNDELYGEAGNDILEGGTGDDLLVGGTGNDLLKGGVGDDTYRFNLGDGDDTIEDTGGTDKIIF